MTALYIWILHAGNVSQMFLTSWFAFCNSRQTFKCWLRQISLEQMLFLMYLSISNCLSESWLLRDSISCSWVWMVDFNSSTWWTATPETDDLTAILEPLFADEFVCILRMNVSSVLWNGNTFSVIFLLRNAAILSESLFFWLGDFVPFFLMNDGEWTCVKRLLYFDIHTRTICPLLTQQQDKCLGDIVHIGNTL